MVRLKRNNVEIEIQDESLVERYKSEGYEVIKLEQELSKLTIKELKALAEEKGIEVSSDIKKDALIELLEGGE